MKEQPINTRDLPLDKAWRVWVKELRDHCPCRFPVKVSRCAKVKGMHGDVKLVEGAHGRYFRIRVIATPVRALLSDTLIHEWAHAMSWFKVKKGEDHGPNWGLAYARCYQASSDL